MFSDYTVEALQRAVSKKTIYSPTLAQILDKDARSGVKKLGQKVGRMAKDIEKYLLKAQEMREFDDQYRRQWGLMVAGVDEAGRGPLAGPVVAASVIFPPNTFLAGIRDSKQLSEQLREKYFCLIHKYALSVGVGMVLPARIDAININNATMEAMAAALVRAPGRPNLILIDGQTVPPALAVPQIPVIKGDNLSQSIAAASIVAKVTRDWLMNSLDEQYPQYKFKDNKGYGTKFHLEAIKKYGPCPLHRMTFLG